MKRLCHSCLRALRRAENDFCGACRQELFDDHAGITTRLSFNPPERSTSAEAAYYHKLTRQISLSGVQEKFSLRLDDPQEQLVLTQQRGQYILKPIPVGRFANLEAVPANEHLTMQLARQVFKLRTAACALFLFTEGSPAYLTRRFDVQPDDTRTAQEDFAQLGNRTEEQHGRNYKYDFSYEGIARLIRQYLPATYLPELTEFFRLLLFNYLVTNGDAHLKNFSLYRLPTGQYQLTPAYDLLCTALHVEDGNGLALDLFEDEEFTTASFEANAFLAYDDFYEFGTRIGLPRSRVRRLLADIVQQEAGITALVERSFLPAELQQTYLRLLEDRRDKLRYSFAASR